MELATWYSTIPDDLLNTIARSGEENVRSVRGTLKSDMSSSCNLGL
jgi:hypothetical protein